ncbi:MAG: tetratricopeptide repeat protein [Candidatus Heimdallarchaeota archaeon]|nr:tetratricopeptide repeat protein [Candidatus Heimdallarchaeota archaeon]MBY8994479.1 tetratricopeptide repeat protein [Candidatus Heimdallarchaeota archaeon]
MFPDQSDKFTQIKNLITEGKFDTALQEIAVISTNAQMRTPERLKFQLLEVEIYNETGKYQQALKLSEDILNNSQKLDDSLQMLDAIIAKAVALSHLGEFGKSLAYIKLGERVLEKLKNTDPSILFIRKATLNYEKGFIFEVEEDLKNSLDSYLQSLSLRREIDDRSGLVKSNNAIARIYFKMGDIVRALLIFQQSLNIARELEDKAAEADILNNICNIYLWKGDFGPALEHCLQSFVLSEEVGDNDLIANSLFSKSLIYNHLGEFDHSLKDLERCLSIREEINDKIGISETLNALSYVLFLKGELNQATNYLNQGQEILQNLETNLGIDDILETLGMILFQRGEYEQAIEQLVRCRELREDQKSKKELVSALFWLILVNIENNTLEEAQDYLKKMQKIIEKQNNLLSNLKYRLASALILKKSNNLDILRKARNIFNEIVNGEIIDIGLYAITLFNLCELYLKQMHISNNFDDMSNLNAMIEKHFKLAEEIESHTMFAENFWLKANVSLMQQKLPEAKLLLDQAEQISNEKGLRRLGMKVSRAIGIIDSHQQKPEIQPSKREIINLEQETEELNGDVIRMIDRRSVEIPKIQAEEPVLLIIVYEGGLTVYSQKFSQKEMIDEMFVGGFLTAIDAFMHQTFATGGSIERIQHQEYTLLLKIENPLLFCYVFKGQSFTAIQKLDTVIKEIKKSSSIWQALINNLGVELGPTENELIEELANKIFLTEE